MKTLSNKISELEASLKLNALQTSQSMETESSDTNNHTAKKQTSPTVSTKSVMKPPPRGILPGECKFNLVIYGITEFPKATPRSE